MIEYKPSPWQQRFHTSDVYETLGGGSAGPGKTLALTADPIQQAMIEAARMARDPRVANIYDESNELFQLILQNPISKGHSNGWYLILRRSQRSLQQVENNAMRLYMTFDQQVRHNVNSHTFTFPTGMRVTFGHCQNPDDWEQYLGWEFTSIGYDELILFEEDQYRMINTRCRTSDKVLRHFRRIKSTTNPVAKRTKDEQFRLSDPLWVKRRFVEPAEPGTVIVSREKAPDGRIVESERIYLPATLYDNPDPEFVRQYEAELIFQKPHIRDALLFGKWDIVVGGYFADDFDKNTHVIRPFRPSRSWRFFRSMDWGYKTPGCVHWWSLSPENVLYCIREYTFEGLKASIVAQRIREIEQKMGFWDSRNNVSRLLGPADNQLWEERGDEGLNKAAEMSRVGVHWVKADKSPGSRRRNGQIVGTRLFDRTKPDSKPTLFIFDSCPKMAESIPLVQTSPNDPEAPGDYETLHWVASLLYGAYYAERGFRGIAPLYDTSERPETDDGQHGYY